VSAPSRTDLSIRSFRPEDEEAVLQLLRSSLGDGPVHGRPAEFFRWKHFRNPFGPSLLLVGEADGQIVGLRAFLRWRFRLAGATVDAVRAVDTATHPDHRGRGVFRRLTKQGLEELRDQVDLVFNTPNKRSLPGYLNMGWTPVGTLRPSVRVRRPRALARAFRPTQESGAAPPVEAPPAAAAFEDPTAVDRLLALAGEQDRWLATDRSSDYLRWRYADVPRLEYRAIVSRSAGRLDGLVVYRVRPRRGLWEATIADLIVPPGDLSNARRLIRDVMDSGSVDVVTGRFPTGSTAARALARTGFLSAPRGVRLVVNPFRPIGVDPRRLKSWALSLGDVEVF
jgi:GNAT superfamily N-acetyltransferase